MTGIPVGAARRLRSDRIRLLDRHTRHHAVKIRSYVQSGFIGTLALAATASAQTFGITGGGGNTFGWGPPSCVYIDTQSTPRHRATNCSDSGHLWTGEAAADRGIVYGTSHVDFHQGGLVTLGTEYHATGEVTITDLVVSGPSASSIPVSVSMDLSFAGFADPGGWGAAYASGIAQVWLNGANYNNQILTNGAQRIVVNGTVTPNAPQYLYFRVTASAAAQGPADNGVPHATTTIAMRFPIGEPVFTLPAGYTVDCPALNIVNNYWLGCEQSELPPLVYGTAKVNSLGCTPSIGWSGAPSASVAGPFLVTASNVLSNKTGLLFYGFAPDAQPFQGGTKLVANPVRRTALQNSGGNPPPDDCSGTYGLDMNARIQGGADPSLVAGAHVFCQYWSRDPASPSSTGLTNGLSFLIGP
jgi:hypothetical protein